MNQKLYSITEFASNGGVSTRTLRYYDNKGLLEPSHYNKLGYRMYSNRDFEKLQYILSLKFLGFSLSEIKEFMGKSPEQLTDVLYQQKMMMVDKRNQLEAVISAIEETENLLGKNQYNYKSIIKVIQAVQMELKPIWMNKYLTTEEREFMRELAKKSYSKEAIKTLADRGWNEENQRSFIERYNLFRLELTRQLKSGVEPESDDAQKLGQMLYEINNNYSKGDENIKEGMKKSWENFNNLQDDRKPEIFKIPEEEREYIKKVMICFHRKLSL